MAVGRDLHTILKFSIKLCVDKVFISLFLLKVLIKVTYTIFRILDWVLEQEEEMKYSTIIILALDVPLNAHLDVVKQDEKS
ncbi:hypothetical protein AHAS_Ahas20G0084700 [Arachis hypogaea]